MSRHTYETTYCLDVRFTVDFIPGRPAYTPRGEYAPIDPPDPAEIAVTGIEVRYDSRQEWRQPTAHEGAVLEAWADTIHDEIVDDAEWNYEPGPDPDAAYDAMRNED
jgi:hypothetical protein